MLEDLLEGFKDTSDQYSVLRVWLLKSESELQEKPVMGDVEFVTEQMKKHEVI